MLTIPEICAELQSAQRRRVQALKSRIMFENRLIAQVACDLGFNPNDDEKSRDAIRERAKEVIAEALEDEDHDLHAIVTAEKLIAGTFTQHLRSIERPMEKLAMKLPVAEWVNQPEQRGFGFLNFSIVIGETGDLSNYANPGKVWRRLGCAPWAFKGRTAMGATWKASKPTLPADQWEAFGYSPRRRSIAYNVGEPLLKLNHGPYRARYDAARAAKEADDDWTRCRKCAGKGKTERGKNCDGCKGTGKVMMHVHRHAMLLMTKLLLRNLWIVWNCGRVEDAEKYAAAHV